MPRRNKNEKYKRTTFNQSCNDKRQFRSEVEAVKAADLQMLMNIGLELAVYKCDTCCFWHLTSRRK